MEKREKAETKQTKKINVPNRKAVTILLGCVECFCSSRKFNIFVWTAQACSPFWTVLNFLYAVETMSKIHNIPIFRFHASVALQSVPLIWVFFWFPSKYDLKVKNYRMKRKNKKKQMKWVIGRMNLTSFHGYSTFCWFSRMPPQYDFRYWMSLWRRCKKAFEATIYPKI